MYSKGVYCIDIVIHFNNIFLNLVCVDCEPSVCYVKLTTLVIILLTYLSSNSRNS